ncbi:MAG: DnaD domain protein [Lachnospiraceae bacterium]|uniref:DnaD domain protein n=1 Tax=Parablautia sp. Marseille-Q6255 TaxID=3039593 RepID=UPI0024BD37B1|nr:DnaD domain protein [Parablautia sp. Marseille-Q6255]
MKIYTGTPEGMTVIHNFFIDQYMPRANGEFVKVYLYLLRCADSGRELSLSSIADVFDCTEKDIHRALLYWEKQGLLSLSGAGSGLSGITFLIPPAQHSPQTLSTAPAATQEPSGSMGSMTGAKKQEQKAETAAAAPSPTRERIATAQEQKEIRQLFYVAEQYLQRPLTSAEQSDFIYYYDDLQFSADLIEYLIEYCVSKGSANRHYMRTVALAWAEAGISTVLQAKEETNTYNKNFFAVLNTFGIRGRGPAAPEQELMSRWFQEFGFSADIVLEACRRTIRQTHQPNFQYADRILEQWKEGGVRSLSDVEQLDRRHRAEQKKSSASTPAPRPSRPAANRFNNFSQREYDYNQLEKQLLNN